MAHLQPPQQQPSAPSRLELAVTALKRNDRHDRQPSGTPSEGPVSTERALSPGDLKTEIITVPTGLQAIAEEMRENSVSDASSACAPKDLNEIAQFVELAGAPGGLDPRKRKETLCKRIFKYTSIALVAAFAIGLGAAIQNLNTPGDFLQILVGQALALGIFFALLSAMQASVLFYFSFLLLLHSPRCFLFSAVLAIGLTFIMGGAALFFPDFVVPLLVVLAGVVLASWLLAWAVVSIQRVFISWLGLLGATLCSVAACALLGLALVLIPLLLLDAALVKNNMRLGLRLGAVPASLLLILAVFLLFAMLTRRHQSTILPNAPPATPRAKKCQFAGQLLLALSLLGYEWGLLFSLEDTLLSGSSDNQASSILAMAGPPLALLAGMKLVEAEGSFRLKYLFYPLCFFLPPALLANLGLAYQKEFRTALLALAVSAPVIGVAWSTLLCVFHRSRLYCVWLLLLLFTGIMLPAALLWPLYEASLLSSQGLRWAAVGLLCASGATGLVIAFKELCGCMGRAKGRKLCSLGQSYSYLGYWGSATAFLLAEGVLLFAAGNLALDTSLRQAFLIGDLGVLPVAYILTNRLLALPVLRPQGFKAATFFDYVFGRAFLRRSLREQVRHREELFAERECQLWVLAAFGLPLGLILLGAIIGGAAGLALGIGSALGIVAIIAGMGALAVKRKLGPFAKNGLPLCLGALWAFVLLPFCAALPFAVLMAGLNNGGTVAMVTVQILVALLVLGTSILSVLLNHVFRRIELEHKAKLAVLRLRHSLRARAVHAEQLPLRMVVDLLLFKGKDVLAQRLLKEGALLALWQLAPTHPDPNVSQVLVLPETKGKLERRSIQQRKKADYLQVRLEQKFQLALASLQAKKQKKLRRLEQRARARAKLQETSRKLWNGSSTAPPDSSQEVAAVGVEEVAVEMPGEEEERKEQQREQAALFYQPSSARLFGPAPGDSQPLLSSRAVIPRGPAKEGEVDAQELRRMVRTENYRVVSSRLSTPEDKLVALFDLVSELATLHTVQELLRASPAARVRLVDELFAYFQEPSGQMERPALARLFGLWEVKAVAPGYFLADNQTGLGSSAFHGLLLRLGQLEYPAYPASLATSQFLVGVVYFRICHYRPDFAGQAFALFLLDAVRREVDAIRAARIQRQLQQRMDELPPDEEDDEALEGRERCQCKNCRRCLGTPRLCCQWLLLKLTVCCCFGGRWPKEDDEEEEEFSAQITEQEIERLRPSKRKDSVRSEELEVAPWDQVSELLVGETEAAVEDYNQKEGLAWQCSWANLVAALLKAIEFISFLSFLFSSDMPWKFSGDEALTIPAGETSSSTFFIFYGLSLALALLYALLIRPAAERARDGSLGMDKDGRAAKFCSRSFCFSKIVSLLSVSLYTFILNSLLAAFACDFQTERLASESSVVCWGLNHFLLMGGALLGVLAYYPFATFLYANLQFLNKDTDLKYHPQFVVYLAQGKLIFSSAASFFRTTTLQLVLRISLMVAVALFLALQSALRQPCLVLNANLFHTTAYLEIAFLLAVSMLEVLNVTDSFGVVGIMVGGTFVLIIVTLILALCRKKRKKKQNQRRGSPSPPPPPDEQDEPEDA